MKFSEAPIGSKIKLQHPAGSWLIARKVSSFSITIINSQPGVPPCIMVEKDHPIYLLEHPHQDNDFSYLCSSEHCRCQQ